MTAGRLAVTVPPANAIRAAFVSAVAVLLLAGCQSADGSGPPDASAPAAQLTSDAGAQASTSRATAGGPRSTVLSTPRPTLSTAQADEAPGGCPYISAADFAELEGDRVGQVMVLQSRPVGCRFYFQSDPGAVVGEITVAGFATATQAYNAMVGSARGHPEVQSDPAIGDGAVAFTTELQGSPSWQCVFAKGASVVTVRTRQPYPALNAFNLARAIAPKIK